MSDRESYVKWYVSEFGRHPIDAGYESDITWKAWQAAQGQAVNQQLLEALRLLYEAAGSIKADEHMLKNYPTLLGAVRVADIAIAAAQENNK